MYKSLPIQATNQNSKKYNRKILTRRLEQSAALTRQNIKNHKIFKAKNMQNRCILTSLPTLSMNKMGLRCFFFNVETLHYPFIVEPQ